LSPAAIDATFRAADGVEGLSCRLDAIVDEAVDAIANGASLLILGDRAVDRDRVAAPALLAVAAVHEGLIARGLRLRVSLVVETGDARDAHQIAALLAFGASAVC